MSLPDKLPADWEATRDTLQQCAQLLGAIRGAVEPKRKHWFHITLGCGVNGLTTGPLATEHGRFALTLDLVAGELSLETDTGSRTAAIDGWSMQQLREWLLAELESSGTPVALDSERFTGAEPLQLDMSVSQSLWLIFSSVDTVLKQFRGALREETGPVQVWPHHFDLAMLWFSGRLVPGVDPADEENADEQMNFGFTPGDVSIAQPYFYITAYPTPEGFTDVALPAGAYWHTEGFTGAILTYDNWIKQPSPQASLLSLLQVVHAAGKAAMLGNGE